MLVSVDLELQNVHPSRAQGRKDFVLVYWLGPVMGNKLEVLALEFYFYPLIC